MLSAHRQRARVQIFPDVSLVSIGGQSIFDRGKDAILPLVAELAEVKRQAHKMVIGVGGGTRVRHTISVALDLGLPTGGVAQLVGAMEEANAVLLNALLAKHGSMPMQREHFWELPLYFDARHHADRDHRRRRITSGSRRRARATCRCTARTSACSSSPRCSA